MLGTKPSIGKASAMIYTSNKVETEMKHVHTYEEFLNEANSINLKLSTNEYPAGTVARFRIESDSINLRKVVNLAKESWSKSAQPFSDNELGFESAGDRKAALNAIQKSFDSGKNDVREFLTESTVNEGMSSKYKTINVDFEELQLRDHLADGPNVGEVSEITELGPDGMTLKRVWTNDKSKRVGELFDVKIDKDAIRDNPKSFIKVTNFS